MLVLFEFIPTASIINYIKKSFGFDKETAIQIQEGEYDVIKDGPLIIFGIITVVLILLLLLISKCNCLIGRDYRVFKIYMKIKQRIFYNSIIRYFYTSAIRIQLTAVDIFLVGFIFTFSCVKNWAMACLILVSLYGSYSAFFIYMRRNRKILDRPSIRAKYGVLYDGFFPIGIYGDNKYIEFYSFTFFLRRAAFVWITFALINYPGL